MKKIITTLLALCIILSGCSSNETTRYSGEFIDLFDTYTQIIIYSKTQEYAQEVTYFLYDEIEYYHQQYDIYNEYEGINNLYTVNQNAGIAPVEVSEDIIQLLKFSIQMYEETDGKVNIAMGSLLSIWSEYRESGVNDAENATLPDMAELEEASLHIDISNIIIDEENSTVYLSDSEMSLDVGAIAKGYAAQCVVDKAVENGYDSFLLSLGGNVIAVGDKNYGDELWSVGVQNPDTDSEEETIASLEIADLSMVTSGDYQRYYTVDGIQYHHIIDSETLFPADYMTSVVVLCDDSGLADAYSTALYIMSIQDGLELVNNTDGIEAMFVDYDYNYYYSDGFEDYIK